MAARQNRARMQFLTWLSDKHPELYNAALERVERQEQAAQLSGLGAEEGESWWQKISGGLLAVGSTYLSLKNQRDAMKLNLARAEQGLPPVDPGITAPVIRTEIDLPPDVINKITGTAGVQVNKMLIFGAAAVLAIMLFMRK